MKKNSILIVAGLVLLYFLLTKKNSGSPIASHPSVATVDYGAYGGMDMGTG